MKYRNLITNLLYVLILVSLVAFLLIEFDVLNFGEFKKVGSTIFLAVAVLSVIVIEVVLPVIANRDMLKNKKYLIRVIIKSLLLLTSAVVLFLYEPFGVYNNMTVALVVFIATYFLQFFINLEPNASRRKTREEIPEEGSDPQE
ncbi:MAG: hypothetical protein J6112_03935 [Clostridia bacterium]|nr:hypothetical protein [Clostridia bacterium]